MGHGGGCLAVGGRVVSISTTFQDRRVHSRIVDGAGPVGGLLAAALALAWLLWAPPQSPNLRTFLCLLFAFTAFWNVGYMVKSGVANAGDWAFVIAGLEPAASWRAGLVIVGVVLYLAAMRLLGAELAHESALAVGWTPHAFAIVALLSATLLAVAGAIFDPRGARVIWSDALPSALGAFGLVWVGFALRKRIPSLRLATPFSPGWIISGLLSSAIFIAVLGPAVRF